MRTYAQFQPTGFDCKGLGLNDRQDWLVGPCGTNRDADVLTRANWQALTELLDKTDPEGVDHESHSFGHWACGHFDIVIVRPGSECARVAEECEGALEGYPVLSESIWSDLENAEVCKCWESMRLKERVELCSETGVSIFAARRDSIPGPCFDALRERL